MTDQEAFDKAFERIDRTGRALFETRQALVFFGSYLAEQLIEAGVLERQAFADGLQAIAEEAGRQLVEKFGGDERPNIDLANIAEALVRDQPPRLRAIDGGKSDGDEPNAA